MLCLGGNGDEVEGIGGSQSLVWLVIENPLGGSTRWDSNVVLRGRKTGFGMEDLLMYRQLIYGVLRVGSRRADMLAYMWYLLAANICSKALQRTKC